MQINEVTILKMAIFTACIIMITFLLLRLSMFDIKKDSCTSLLKYPEVKESVISRTCPEGFYPNFGKFPDVDDGYFCCVKYG